MCQYLVRVCVCLAVAPCFFNSATGDDGILGQQPGFSDIVYQALEQRSQLHAGEFEYKVTITKSGEERPSSVQRGLYSYDDRIGNTLHVYLKTSLENEDSRDTLSTIAGGVYNAPPGDTVYITSDLENTFTPSDPLNRRKNQLKPFEFRSFGFANASDISQNADFEKLIVSHIGSDDTTVRSVDTPRDSNKINLLDRKSDILCYERGFATLCFDKSRDLWPVLQRFVYPVFKKSESGELKLEKQELISQTEIELQEVEGKWVPQHVHVVDKNASYEIDMKWKLLNSPVDEFDLTIERANTLAIDFAQRKLSETPWYKKGLFDEKE
jgi:hypothetical protein